MFSGGVRKFFSRKRPMVCSVVKIDIFKNDFWQLFWKNRWKNVEFRSTYIWVFWSKISQKTKIREISTKKCWSEWTYIWGKMTDSHICIFFGMSPYYGEFGQWFVEFRSTYLWVFRFKKTGKSFFGQFFTKNPHRYDVVHVQKIDIQK